jgi:acetyltransferase-like isoleucine patch superfamily enzyme
MLRRLKRLLLEPGATLAGLLDYYVYPRIVARNAGLTLRGRLFVRGMPRVRIGDGASVTIGDNVTLNSQDRGYHLNIFAPMKIMADRPGAEIVIGDNTRMTGTCIHAYLRITIGKNCLIAANTQIFDGSAHDLCFPNVEDRIHTVGGAKEIVIEDNVWIGANSIVLPGVTIGYGSVVAAGSVVTKSIPPYALAGGNPTRVIRDFSPPRVEGQPARSVPQ